MFPAFNVLFEIGWYLSTGQAYPDSYRVAFFNCMQNVHCIMPHFSLKMFFLYKSCIIVLDLEWMSDSLLALICFEPFDYTLAISFSLVILSFKF